MTQADGNNGTFLALTYEKQIVNGTNYDITFTSGTNTYTAKVYVPLPSSNGANNLVSVTKVVAQKKK